MIEGEILRQKVMNSEQDAVWKIEVEPQDVELNAPTLV